MMPTSPEWLLLYIIAGTWFVWWFLNAVSEHKHRRIEIDYRILQRK